jgi:hypothetical protein
VLDAALRVRRANPRYFEMLATTPRRRSDASCSSCRTGSGARRDPHARRALERGRRSEQRRRRARARRRRRARAARARAAPGPRAGEAAPSLLFVVENRATLRARDAASETTGRLVVGEATTGDDLVSRASHELRGPFGSIANWVHLCPRARRTARSCSRASRRSTAR